MTDGRRAPRAALAAALLAAACGNGDFDHLKFVPPNPGGGIVLEPKSVSLPVGGSATVSVTAIDTGGDEMECDVGVLPGNPSVMRTERTANGQVVFRGVRAGETAVIVYCDGDYVGYVPGHVLGPSAM